MAEIGGATYRSDVSASVSLLSKKINEKLHDLNKIRKTQLKWIIRKFLKNWNTFDAVDGENANKNRQKSSGVTRVTNFINSIKLLYENIASLDNYLLTVIENHENRLMCRQYTHLHAPSYTDSVLYQRNCKRILDLYTKQDDKMLFSLTKCSKVLSNLSDLVDDGPIENASGVSNLNLTEKFGKLTEIKKETENVYSHNRNLMIIMKFDFLCSNLTKAKLSKSTSVYPRRTQLNIQKLVEQVKDNKYIPSTTTAAKLQNISKLPHHDQDYESERRRKIQKRSFSEDSDCSLESRSDYSFNVDNEGSSQSCNKKNQTIQFSSSKKKPRSSQLVSASRKRRSSSSSSGFNHLMAFDDDIIVPYAECAPQRIEHIPYKEIVLPEWSYAPEISAFLQNNPESNQICKNTVNEHNEDLAIVQNEFNEDTEDISDEAYIRRHQPLEIKERERYLGFDDLHRKKKEKKNKQPQKSK